MTTNPADLAHIAAATISEARQRSGLTNAEFDHQIAIHGVGGPMGAIGQAAFTITTRDMDATTDEREAVWRQAWADLQPEMDAYAKRCRDRTYSGWSNANPDPIRYA